MSEHLRQYWSRSRGFRVALIIALICVLLRLVAHGLFLANLQASGGIEGYDLQVYLDAAKRITRGENLYPRGTPDWIEFYQYSPAYALVFTPLLQLPLAAIMIVFSLLHIAAYGSLYWLWGRIFQRLGLKQANNVWAWTAPIWLVFSQFWADLSYLNVYIFMALLSTLLIKAVIEEQLGWSLLWLSIILQTKPQWAFPIVLPLLLGRHRFFFRLLSLTIVAYAAIIGVVMLMVGPSYGLQQYGDYTRLLWSISSGSYPWRGPEAPFLGYNHSVTQIVVYLLGVSPGSLRLATGIQALLLAPLAILCARHLIRPIGRSGDEVPQLGLDLAFVLYLGAFIWLDVVWELSLGIAVFTYLLATLRRLSTKVLTWVVFLPYALVDLWQLMSVIVWGQDIVVPGPYILTDPSIYVPLVMIVILTFYALLIKRLWQPSAAKQRG